MRRARPRREFSFAHHHADRAIPAGWSTDVAGRILAQRMGVALGQSVIVENIGGAGGSIGVGRLARAAPDGYTIDIGQWDTHVGSIIYNLNYDLQKDFAPIGLDFDQSDAARRQENAAGGRSEIAGGLDEGASRRRQIRQPERVGAGRRPAAAEAHRHKVLFVPYRGAGPAMTDLISGQVDLLLVQGAVALPQVRAGTVKALAELSPQRSPSMPDIASADESGVPGL